MKQETGSNLLENNNGSEIYIQIYRGGFSVVYPLDDPRAPLYFDALDLSTLQGVLSQFEGRISQVVFSVSDVTLVPLELYEMASPWEHLAASGIPCWSHSYYAQTLEDSSCVVVWAVDSSLAGLLEELLDVRVVFTHTLGLVLGLSSAFGADAFVYQQDSLSVVLHYGHGRLLNHLVLEDASPVDLLYYLGRFAQSGSSGIGCVELLGDCSLELYELLSRYYGLENVKKE